MKKTENITIDSFWDLYNILHIEYEKNIVDKFILLHINHHLLEEIWVWRNHIGIPNNNIEGILTFHLHI